MAASWIPRDATDLLFARLLWPRLEAGSVLDIPKVYVPELATTYLGSDVTVIARVFSVQLAWLEATNHTYLAIAACSVQQGDRSEEVCANSCSQIVCPVLEGDLLHVDNESWTLDFWMQPAQHNTS